MLDFNRSKYMSKSPSLNLMDFIQSKFGEIGAEWTPIQAVDQDVGQPSFGLSTEDEENEKRLEAIDRMVDMLDWDTAGALKDESCEHDKLGEVTKSFMMYQKLKGKNGVWFALFEHEMNFGYGSDKDTTNIHLHITAYEPTEHKDELRAGVVDFTLILGTVQWSNINRDRVMEMNEISTNLKFYTPGIPCRPKVIHDIMSAISDFEIAT